MRIRLIKLGFAITALLTFCFARIEAKNLFVPWVQTSPCTLPLKDPLSPQNFPSVCLNADAESTVLTSTSEYRPDHIVNFAQGYAGLHLHRLFSYHIQAIRRRAVDIETKKVPEDKDDSTIDEHFIQLGNAAYHRPRMALGRINLPYGLDISPLPELYNFTVKTRRYYTLPTYAMRFTFDNMLDTQIEIGYGTDDWEKVNQTGFYPSASNDATAVRISHDISALGGSRLMLFGYATQQGERRFGGAVLNITRNGTINAFEWQRRRLTSLGRKQKLQQLFRINYEAPNKHNPKFIFEFEHDHQEYWLLTFGQNYHWDAGAEVKFMAGYYSTDRVDMDSHWICSLSLGATL